MYPGATELVLMLSLAHSHAKFFDNWISEAEKTKKWLYIQDAFNKIIFSRSSKN
jgi:hypothetical protein